MCQLMGGILNRRNLEEIEGACVSRRLTGKMVSWYVHTYIEATSQAKTKWLTLGQVSLFITMVPRLGYFSYWLGEDVRVL